MKLVSGLLTIITCVFAQASFAQHADWYIDRHDELYLSEGVITVEEANGWEGRGTGLAGYISTPQLSSGALFLSYRHFLNDRFAIGGSAGIDNEMGELSYGDPKLKVSGGSEGQSGNYSVHIYTFSVESLFAYKKEQNLMLYCYVGLGATHYNNVSTLDSEALTSHDGPRLPTNPYNHSDIHWTAQITPFGVRFGKAFAGFFEFGFGYKGLICGGISARF